jgi:hypothetical protein
LASLNSGPKFYGHSWKYLNPAGLGLGARDEETNGHAPQDERRNETSGNAIEIDNDKKTEGDRHG